MPHFNKVILMGHLTRDPDLRFIQSGTPVAQFGLAINRRRNGEGGPKEEVTFIEVVAWGRLAEICGEYLTKGAPILVEGRIQQDRWETEEGEHRSQLKVIAETVRFLPWGRSREEEDDEEGTAVPI